MMYLKCPSCKKLLGDKQLPYENILNRICSDEEMGKISSEEASELKSKLIKSFEFERYCCTPRVMTYKKLIEIVK